MGDWPEILKLEGGDLEGGVARFTGNASPDWTQGRAVFGGLVGTLMAQAAQRTLPADRTARSLLINFVSPLSAAPFEVNVSVLRAGRAMSQVHVQVVQEGNVTATLSGAYGAPRQTSLDLKGDAPDSLAGIESLTKLPYVAGLSPQCTQFFEYFITKESAPFSGSAKGHMEGYVRHTSPGPTDAAGLLILLDAWPPVVLPMLSAPASLSTVTWMIDFLGEPAAPGTLSDAAFAYKADATFVHAGYASSEARLWSPSGELLAASRQLVAEFS